MNKFQELQQRLATPLSSLNAVIKQSLSSDSALMNQIVDGFLQKKGKQIRPILVLMSGKFFGNTSERVLHAGAAIELLHNASLIHDDVIDEAKSRRGIATINRVWDNHIAVLAGDFFVSSALSCAVRAEDPRIVSVMARLSHELALGEINQIDNARHHHISEMAYLNTIRHKTASLFRCCVEVGGYAAGAPLEQLTQIMDFAELLGLCFQIKDDIFDYCAQDETIGKPTGNDLREGKITLPLIYALSRTDAPDHEQMVALVAKSELSPDDIAALISFAIREGGIEYAEATMQRFKNQAFAILDRFPHSEAVDDFRGLFEFIIERKH